MYKSTYANILFLTKQQKEQTVIIAGKIGKERQMLMLKHKITGHQVGGVHPKNTHESLYYHIGKYIAT